MIVGCRGAVEEHYVPWPVLPAEVRSALVVTRAEVLANGEAERLLVDALPVEDGRIGPVVLEFAEDPGLRLDLLAYHATLSELDLAQGRVPRATGDRARPVPAPDLLQVWSMASPAPEWVGQEALDPVVAELRIPAADPVACLAREACPVREAGRSCRSPCGPMDGVATPMPPGAPTGPEIWGRGCDRDTSTISLSRRSLAVCPQATVPPTCPPGMVQPPDLDVCVAIGAACAPRWRPAPVGVPMVHVDGKSQPPGDGSAGAPFPSIAAAVANAAPGAWVVIAPGRYAEEVTIDAGLTLLGACAEETVLVGQGGAAVRAQGPGRVSGLRIEGGFPGVVLDRPESALELSEVELVGGELGLQVLAGHLDARSVIVRGPARDGIAIEGGSADLRAVYVEDPLASAIVVTGGASLVADHLVLRRPRRAGSGGEGISVVGGGVAQLTQVLIEGHASAGLVAAGALTSLSAVDVVIRAPSGTDGSGLRSQEGGHLEGRQIRIEGLTKAGVAVVGATGDLEDLEVVGLGFEHAAEVSPLVEVAAAGALLLRRARLQESPRLALALTSAEAEVTDLAIARVAREENQASVVVADSRLTADRLLIEGSGGHGIYTDGIRPSLLLRDVKVVEGKGTALELGGRGDQVTVERMEIGPADAAAVVASSGTEVVVRDLWVHGIRPASSARNGAVVLKDESGADFEGFLIEDNQQSAFDLAVSLGASRPKSLRRGVVARNGAGMIFRGELSIIPEIFEDVVFRENRTLLGNPQ